jgi:hypothetical protein
MSVRASLQYTYNSLTSVVSVMRSCVTPTCSLLQSCKLYSLKTKEAAGMDARGTQGFSELVRGYSLCDSEQVIPVNTLVLAYFIVWADSTCVDHDATLWVGLGIEQVVAF